MLFEWCQYVSIIFHHKSPPRRWGLVEVELVVWLRLSLFCFGMSFYQRCWDQCTCITYGNPAIYGSLSSLYACKGRFLYQCVFVTHHVFYFSIASVTCHSLITGLRWCCGNSAWNKCLVLIWMSGKWKIHFNVWPCSGLGKYDDKPLDFREII